MYVQNLLGLFTLMITLPSVFSCATVEGLLGLFTAKDFHSLSKKSFLILFVFLDLVSLQSLENMLLFQYLVNSLEVGFQPRNCIYAGKFILNFIF
ncbi:hypothetical protein RchiOBHm_Chr3g0477101 [Rosa chinensis]|uniref:Uncharacterized protein n=1 Tax=Rosa chinensis TaxID=74649 RepID=A0A2P6RCT5_ROSCH|nr:hypothetical protein RchiOBHm_Chr3g0477101 [Rosa chinensis]